jgi:hypothetical protein
MLKLSDSRNFAKSLAGLGLILGPVLIILAVLIGPEPADEADEFLQNVADAEGRTIVSQVLFLLAGLALVPGALGIIRLGRDRSVTFAQVAGGLVFLGVIVLLMVYVIGVFDLAMADEAADRAEMVALSERAEEHGLAWVVFIMFLVGFVLGNILVGIALWRRGVLPVWGAAAIVLAVIVGFLAEARLLEALAFVLLLVAYGYLGLKILGMSEEEWEGVPARGAVAAQPPAP